MKNKMDLDFAIQLVAERMAHKKFLCVLTGTGNPDKLSIGEGLSAIFNGKPNEIEDKIYKKAQEIYLSWEKINNGNNRK